MSKDNLLLRYYSTSKGDYGEPFAICQDGYHALKQHWIDKGLIVEQVGKTDWPCNNHEDHATDPASEPLTHARASSEAHIENEEQLRATIEHWLIIDAGEGRKYSVNVIMAAAQAYFAAQLSQLEGKAEDFELWEGSTIKGVELSEISKLKEGLQ